MKLQRQPNNWSCLPTAFAIVLDKPVEELLKAVGHDGSEIVDIWKDLPDPYCRRSFHPQELVLTVYKLGYLVTPFEACLSLITKEDYPDYRFTQDIGDIIKNSVGVFTGMTIHNYVHAVAWDGKRCYDSGGFGITDINDFQIRTFWMVRINNQPQE